MHSFLRPNAHPHSINISPVIAFVKNWTLPLAIVAGIAAYFIYVNIPALDGSHRFVGELIAVIQPLLIFSMLFLTFLTIGPHDLRLRRWHFMLVGLQLLLFAVMACGLSLIADDGMRIVCESAMLCLLCPTATAAAVVTRKLDGSAADITAYTILINLAMALTAPALLPLAHPIADMNFVSTFAMIIGKVFPLLICPLLLAWVIRKYAPALAARLTQFRDLPFYLWAIALSLAIGVTVKAIVHSTISPAYFLGIVVVTLCCCIGQFYIGKKVGSRYGQQIEGGQALGQKNTVFIIWMGYTFLSPVTAMAGGLYSVWHNVYNSWQLYNHRKHRQE
ncbi:MAG: transporter [Bacteroides sp.]|nr:transporter [Bacteroides sp.]MCM1414058.1 transporter [Bacteroides sp.]MCM1472343.1 transporter [Bacteroides sp.]